MKIRNKTIGKRILAVLLSLLTVLSCMTIGFAPAYALDSTAKEWNGHHRFSVDGKDAYCINYGKASNGKFETNAAAQKYWSSLGSTKQNNIKKVLTYAGDKGYLNSSKDETYFAVQRAIWKQINSKAENELTSWFKSQTKSVYDDIIDNYKGSAYKTTKPKFDAIKLEPQYDKDGNVTSYKGSGTDKSSVLSNWSITDKAGLTVSTSGNKLNVSTKSYFAGKKTIKLKSKKKFYTIASDQIGHFGDQEVIAIGSSEVEYTSLKASCDNIQTGSIQITKIAETGEVMSGIQFNLYDLNGTYLDSDWTNENGIASFDDIDAGTYTVTELTPAGYVPYGNIGSVQVTVTANQTTNVANHPSGKWVNTLQRGDIYIHKTIEDTNTPYQAQFTLYDSDGNYVLSGTTNTAGDLYFCNVPTGYYQLKETNTFNGNVIDWQKVYYTYDYNSGQYVANKGDSIYVAWDGQTSYPYANQVCHNGWLNDNDNAANGGVNLCDWYNLINYSGENTIVNRYKRGDLRLHKLAEEPVEVSENGYTYKYTSNDNVGTYKSLSGATFTATSYSNQNVLGRDLTFTTTTGADGYAYFCDMPIGVYTTDEKGGYWDLHQRFLDVF